LLKKRKKEKKRKMLNKERKKQYIGSLAQWTLKGEPSSKGNQ
jgi:hypothetical protein